MRGIELLSLVYIVILGSAVIGAHAGAEGLRRNFYWRSCPRAEDIVRRITWASVVANPSLPGKLVRLVNHDCFVRGCDASILLDSVGSTQSEKHGESNLSVTGYELIDQIKEQLERVCPGVVSCADVIALSARDSISYQFGVPMWNVPTGRRDGSVSLASEVKPNFPTPTMNFTALQQFFAAKGFDVRDLVALSGAHTLGISHCNFFANRLNFTGRGDTDPALDQNYADYLRRQCPTPFNPAATVEMDPRSSFSFDTGYFTAVLQRRGLLQSDAALLTDPAAASIVREFQRPRSFFNAFAVAMEKMGAMGVLTGSEGEIRRFCRAVNV